MTGEQVWSYAYDCEYRGVGYQAGPRASVIIKDGKAYSLGTMGHLICFDAGTGNIIWQKDLDAEYDIRMPIWGIAAAPLINRDKIILQIGGENNAGVIALSKDNGKELWRNLPDDAGYSAPVLVKQGNQPVVIFWTGQNLLGLDPNNGQLFWSFEFQQKMIIGISTPVIYEDHVFISSFFNGSMLVKLDPNKPEASMVWKRSGKNERNTDALHCCISTPVLKDNHIFGVDSYGELRCLDLLTGDRVWEDLTAVKKARWANIHFVQNGGLSYMFNEQGELIIAKLTSLGYEEISRSKLIEPTTEQLNRSGVGVTWAHPAFAYKHVFIRNDQELVCADLSEQ
jgi:outer membrane protein assembly factor BamB